MDYNAYFDTKVSWCKFCTTLLFLVHLGIGVATFGQQLCITVKYFKNLLNSNIGKVTTDLATIPIFNRMPNLHFSTGRLLAGLATNHIVANKIKQNFTLTTAQGTLTYNKSVKTKNMAIRPMVLLFEGLVHLTKFVDK